MLERNQVERYLEIIQKLKKSYTLIDMHVHPFDVMFNDFNYINNSQCDGIYSANANNYVSPDIGQLKISQLSDTGTQSLNSELRAKMAMLTSRRLYAHTGPKLFRDHMRLSGIDKTLLLPVVSADESDNEQIKMLAHMFGDDERFALGYCIPNCIDNDEIGNVVKVASQDYNIKAIKIHPNITGIDIFSSSGKERIEFMLKASRDTKLPVIIHGGRSSGLRNPEATEYSTLTNLQHIDWSITNQAVVVAHAGTYGYDLSQITEEILPLMSKLLSQYSNLFVDISGLTFEEISAILRNIDTDRILFGSDALYNSQWGALVKLFYALQKSISDYEEVFLKIVSHNPSRLIMQDSELN